MGGPNYANPAKEEIKDKRRDLDETHDDKEELGRGNAANASQLGGGSSDPVDDEVDALKKKLQALADKEAREYVSSAQRILQNASAEAKKRLWEDKVFLTQAAWEDQPQTLHYLFTALDPVTNFHAVLLRDYRVNGPSGVLPTVEKWAKANPGLSPTVLMNARVMSTLDMYVSGEDKIKAIQLLLYKGVLPVSPRDSMDRALEAGDEEQFLLAWHKITADKKQLSQLQQDAEFLDRIQEKLPSGTFEMVKATLFRATELSSEELDTKLRPIVDAYLKQLDELNDYWVNDETVLTALRGLDREVRAVGEKLPIGADKTMAHAQKMLARQYKALYGDELKDRLIIGLQGKGETEGLKLAGFAGGGGQDEGQSADESGSGADVKAWQAAADLASMEVAGELHVEIGESWVYVDDKTVGTIFDRARTRMVELANTHGFTDAKAILEHADQAMVMVKTAYDRQFGSLVDDLHQYVQTEAIRNRALMYIGDRADPTKAAAYQIANGDKNDDVTSPKLMADSVDLMMKEMHEVAAKLDAALSGGSVRDTKATLTTFKGTTFSTVENGSSGFDGKNNADKKLEMLEAAYKSYGGSLKHGVIENLSADGAKQVFDLMGWGSPERLTASEQDQGLSDDALAARASVRQSGKRLFDRIVAFPGARRTHANGEGKDPTPRLVLAAKKYQALLETWQKEGGPTAEDPYETENGISLAMHLGMTLMAKEADQVSDALGGLSIPLQNRVSSSEADKKELDGSQFSFDTFEVGSTFNLEEAKKRAIGIHDMLANNVKGARLAIVEDGNQAELSVVIKVFKELYGFDPLFRIRELEAKFGEQAGTDGAKQRLQDAGQAGLGQRMLDHATAQNASACYKLAMDATADEKKELLNDGALLAKVRKALGAEAYERVYLTISGQLELGDALRTREGWWWFGWGTDNKGMEGDIGAFVSEIKKTLAGIKDPKVSDEQLKSKLRELWAKPEIRGPLERELNEEEKLKMEQLILSGGAQTGTDKSWAEAEGWGGSKNLLAHLKEMTDEERKLKRTDARFLAMISDQLRGGQYEQAMQILMSDKGGEQNADISKAIGGGGVDERGVIDAVASMSVKDLLALASDTRRLAEIRARLNNRDDERKLFDALIADAKKKLGDGSLKPEHNAKGAPSKDWSPEAKAQHKAKLVLEHSFKLQSALYAGRDEALAAAQVVYSEKGEIAPCKGDEKTKEELFTIDERKQVWKSVETDFNKKHGYDEAFLTTMKKAILGEADPSGQRLDLAFDWSDNIANAKDAIAKASEKTLIYEWSNIVKNGDEDKRNLKALYEAYQKADADLNCKVAPSDEDKRKRDVAKYQFVDFPLDVSGDLVDVFNQEDNSVGWTTTRQLLELKQLVRTRLVSLPSPAIAKAIGMPGAEDYKNLKDDDANKKAIDAVNGEDRQARSMHSHVKDVAHHQMDAFSLADGTTYSDEQMATYWEHYAGAYGEATEKTDKDADPFGMISKEEKAQLDKRRADFNVSVEEYKKAKSKCAEVMKWAAILLIGAIATAVTGPGGATLMAAMITAGIQAGVSVAIDEMVQGNDYDASTEGVQKIITDVVMAGATHKLNSVWETVSKTNPYAQKLVGAQEWLKKLDADILAGLENDLGTKIIYEVGKASGNVVLSEVKDAAVASLDVSELKYGWRQGMTNANQQFESRINGMDEKLLRTAITTTVTQLGGAAKEKVGLGEDKKTPGLPGAQEEELDVSVSNRDLLELLAASSKENLGPKAALGAAWDQAVTTVAGKASDAGAGNRVGISEADLWSFAETYAKGRAGAVVSGVGTEAQKDRTSQLVAERYELAQNDPVLSSDPLAMKYYLHHLRTTGKNNRDGSLGETPSDFRKGKWNEITTKVDTQLGDQAQTTEGNGYRAWVLADPSKVDERLGTTYASFQEGQAKGQAYADKLQATAAKVLTPEEQDFFTSYAKDATRLFNFQDGTLDDTYNLETAAGLKTFRDSMRVSKSAMGASYFPEVTQGLSEEDKKDFALHFQTTGVDNVVFDPARPDANKAAVAQELSAWQAAQAEEVADTQSESFIESQAQANT